MTLTEAQVRDLVLRWTVRAPPSAEDTLTDDFVFESEALLHGKADFVLGMQAQMPWRDVRVLAILIGPDKAAAFFEGVDPATNLSYRVAWLIDHNNGSITKVIANHTILGPSAAARVR